MSKQQNRTRVNLHTYREDLNTAGNLGTDTEIQMVYLADRERDLAIDHTAGLDTTSYAALYQGPADNTPGSPEATIAGIAEWCLNTTIVLMTLPFSILGKLFGGR